MPNDLVYANTIAEKIQTIVSTDVKPAISLANVHVGNVLFVPPAALTQLVDGVWIHPLTVSNGPAAIPTPLEQMYNFRLVYVRRIRDNENPVKQDMINSAVIVNKLMDKFTLPGIVLPNFAQVLWCLWRGTDFEPGEDDYVYRVAADLKAVAMTFEVKVMTKRQ